MTNDASFIDRWPYDLHFLRNESSYFPIKQGCIIFRHFRQYEGDEKK